MIKAADDKKGAPKTKEANKAAAGKWKIKQKSESDFYVYLIANNGQILLSSEAYTTPEGAITAIATIQKNVEQKNFSVYCDKTGKYYYKIKTVTNRLLCVGETYTTKSNCISSLESVAKFAQSAVVSDTIEKELTEIVYVQEGELPPAKDGYCGKWKIAPVNEMYMAQLYASNGELLISGESYTTVDAAKKSIDSITEKAKEGNFIIDRDKNKNYYFKLRNSSRIVLAVGEIYKSKTSCVSALESVIRFCDMAKKEF